MLTDQEAFTRMVQHLRTQGSISRNEDGKCLYRHPDGIRRCAVGVLIPDNEYREELERLRINTVVRKVPTLQSINFYILREMQWAHDEHRFTTNKVLITTGLEEDYKRIAKKFNLIVPPHPCSLEAIEEEVVAMEHNQLATVAQ